MEMKNHIKNITGLLKVLSQYIYSIYKVNDVAYAFLADENVEEVGVVMGQDCIYADLLLKDDDIEDLDLNLAKIQNSLTWRYKRLLPIELNYSTAEYYSRELGSVIFKR